jgi:DNA-binding NtrC family response regulator
MTTLPVMPNGMDHVLVASPNISMRQQVLDSLLVKARRVEQASGGAEALVHLEQGCWQLLLLDRRLPDLDAEELRETVRKRYPDVEVVLLDECETGGNTAESQAVVSPQLPRVTGGLDSWRDESDGQMRRVSDDLQEAWDCGKSASSKQLAHAAVLPGMVGDSAVMQAVYRLVNLVAPRDTTVLITGPTGSGKELVARALHQLSPRAAHALAVVNCAAIPETMLEAELFGYSRGAFTGALQSYAGRIQTAHLGTLFLDEIGDMPLSLQPKLLRFLEQKEVQRLGSSQMVRVNARVVAATNGDLAALVSQGKFREDLYYRLSAFPIDIPPLTDRPGDIAQLAACFLERFSQGQRAPVLSEEAAATLRLQTWPGNVRELQNVIERALILADGVPVVSREHLLFSNPATRMPGR